MWFSEDFENRQLVAIGSSNKNEEIDNSLTPMRAVVNMDGTINTYPKFRNSRKIEEYRQMKARLLEVESELKLAEKNYEVNPLFSKKTMEQLVREWKVLDSRIKRDFSYLGQRNTSSKGMMLKSKKKQRIKNVLTYQYRKFQETKKRFQFVTMTVPPLKEGIYNKVEHDQIVMKQFSKFLENLRKNYGLKSYVWVTERQTGKRNDNKFYTGAIHFHIVMDWSTTPPHPQRLNLYWLILLDKVGFRTTTKSKNESDLKNLFHENYSENIKSKYKSGSVCSLLSISANTLIFCYPINERGSIVRKGNKNPYLALLPQPYDVKTVFSLKSLKNYLTKYIAKNDSKMYCRVYGMSRDLSNLLLHVDVEENNLNRLLLDDTSNFEWSKTFDIEVNNRIYKYAKHIVKEETWRYPFYGDILEAFLFQDQKYFQQLYKTKEYANTQL